MSEALAEIKKDDASPLLFVAQKLSQYIGKYIKPKSCIVDYSLAVTSGGIAFVHLKACVITKMQRRQSVSLEKKKILGITEYFF